MGKAAQFKKNPFAEALFHDGWQALNPLGITENIIRSLMMHLDMINYTNEKKPIAMGFLELMSGLEPETSSLPMAFKAYCVF